MFLSGSDINTCCKTNLEPFASIVLFEDNHLLVVSKPPGMLVQGDRSNRPALLDLAKEYIRIKYRKPGRVYLGLVHRLDRLVGGAIVLARTSKAAERLSLQFRTHQVDKRYWAVVHGTLSPPAGRSTVHLLRKGHLSVVVDGHVAEARKAGLTYRTLDTGDQTSLVEVILETGRRHQIRAQLSGLGHPVCGDPLYGSFRPPENDSIGLFSRFLTFDHPTTGSEMTFEAQLPRNWPWLPLR
jgi:23S rRNA pseudouridine1911/1915/1917 synthase